MTGPEVHFDVEHARFATRQEADAFLAQYGMDDFHTHGMADIAFLFFANDIAEAIDRAVAAEREACEAIAEKWRKTWDDLAREFQGKDVSMARNAASLANAAWQIKSDIHARREGGEQATT